MKDTLLNNFANLKETEKLSLQFTNGDGVVLTKDADLAIVTYEDGYLVSILTQEDILIKVPFNNICYWIIVE